MYTVYLYIYPVYLPDGGIRVCPLHFYDKEKLYGYVHTGEAETKSYILRSIDT